MSDDCANYLFAFSPDLGIIEVKLGQQGEGWVGDDMARDDYSGAIDRLIGDFLLVYGELPMIFVNKPLLGSRLPT